MRAFIGILAPEEVKEVAMKIGEELAGIGVVGKFVERENLHINLSFLDEITEEEYQEFAAKMDMIAKGYKKFQANVYSIKAIPNERFTRVIAFGVEDESRLLVSLSREIQKTIGGDVKPPHMTLSRVKGMKDKGKFAQMLDKYKTTTFAVFEVNSIQLLKSELDREGPVYKVLHESKFS